MKYVNSLSGCDNRGRCPRAEWRRARAGRSPACARAPAAPAPASRPAAGPRPRPRPHIEPG